MARKSEADAVVGRRLRQRRVMLGISQTALARTLGITFQQIQKYESGKNRISAGRLQQMANALDLPIAAFFDPAVWPRQNDEQLLSLASTREGAELNSAFSRISNREVRERIINLVRAIAAQHRSRSPGSKDDLSGEEELEPNA
ncbi:helix-turn-helix domain-containing protein [Jiella sp. M17.18]|uniref:helix-turn-helix domain-containing protein n=1 Tax=Jiella sp. M17.18 TaxID=3234247 RepID=UPI0034DEF80F